MSNPVRIRASSWGALFSCAHRWEGIHILKLPNVVGVRATLGTAVHASTALFDLSRMHGTGLTAMETAAALVDELRHPKGEVDFSGDDMTVDQAEKIGLTLHGRYCADVSPHYEFTSVEMETKPLIVECSNGVKIQLTGTLDRSRTIAGEFGNRIADLKTGRNAVTKNEDGDRVASTRGHAAQVGTYELLSEHTTGQPITGPAEIIGMSTGSKPEIAMGTIVDARRTLVGTEESPGLIEYAGEMLRSGLFPPNPQSMLCGQKYCPRWNTCTHHY